MAVVTGHLPIPEAVRGHGLLGFVRPDRWSAPWSGRWSEGALVLAVAVVAGLVRVPFVAAPLGADEGGFLMVAAQWSPGTSLYGDYWVDRPPLLIALFALADHLGGVVPLRLLAVLLVMTSVLLAGRIGALLSADAGAGPTGPESRFSGGLPAAVTAAVFLVDPLFGALEVNGELLAVPFVLAGIAAILTARQAPTRRARSWWLGGAGAAAAAAALVKQNEIDVVIFGLVALVTSAVVARRRGRHSRLGPDLATLAGGAAVVSIVALLAAAARGTSPAGLWDALVVFRAQALTAIQQSTSGASDTRLWHLLTALVASGALVLVVQLVRHLLRSRGTTRPLTADLHAAVLALLAWEMVSVLGGGSYWLHYLVALVPGLVVAVGVVAAPRRAGSTPTVRPLAVIPALAGCALVAAVSMTGVVIVSPPGSTEVPVASWLSQHARPGDTAVVAYGHPNILRTAGLSSPYANLWSLPARVLDPRLAQLSAVLAGPQRPTWVITGTHGLDTWGIDPAAGDAQLAAHYRPVARVDDHVIYLDQAQPRP